MNRQFNLRPVSRPRVRATVTVKYTSAGIVLAMIATTIALIWLNLGTPEVMKAESPSNTIATFTWEDGLSDAKEGISYDSISSDAYLKTYDGTDKGISPGSDPDNDGIKMTFDKSNFEIDGIDVSMKYRYYDQNATFISRGDCMEFDITNRKLNVKYRSSVDGANFVNTVANNIYTIANGDTDWHTYRFVYDPNYAEGSVMVDGDTVWSNNEAAGSKLFFVNCGQDVVVGKGMTASGADIAVLDDLSLKSIPFGALPVEYEFVQAQPKDGGVKFEWKTFSEVNLSGFEVERSTDGRFYQTIEAVPSLAMDGSGTDYGIFDADPQSGINYYRVKSIDMDGSLGWSDVVAVEIVLNENAVQEVIREFTVYPNPVRAGAPVQMQLEASVSGTAHIELYNLGGQRVLQQQKELNTGMNNSTVSMNSSLTPGVYIFKVELNGEKKTARLVVQ